MRATLPYIAAKFHELNAQCFGDQLPPIALRINHASSRLGVFAFNRNNPAQSRRISISDRYDLPPHKIANVLLHEMIHYYLHLTHQEDPTAHGPNFRSLMNRLNADHGFTMSIRTQLNPATRLSGQKERLNLIGIITLANGSRAMTICGKGSLARIHSSLRRSPQVRSIEWYLSFSPFFSQYPLLRSPKCFPLPANLPLSEMTKIQ